MTAKRERVPHIRLRLEKPNVKMTIKFAINDGEQVQGKDGWFIPQMVEVRIWPGKAYVYLSSGSSYRYQRWPNTAQFNLTDTKYPECPEWLRDLINTAIEAIDG